MRVAPAGIGFPSLSVRNPAAQTGRANQATGHYTHQMHVHSPALALISWLLWAGCSNAVAPGDSTEMGTDVSTDTGSTTESTPGPVPEPHVVFVLVDDLGWTGPAGGQTSLGMGSDYHKTPVLDALSGSAVSFTAAYASPQCQPSRGAILSGMQASRTRMYTNHDPNRAPAALRALDAPPNTTELGAPFETIAERMQGAGWRTGQFGKWHIGVPGQLGPEEQGFDINVGGTESGVISGGSDGHFARSDGAWALPNLPANGVNRQFVADRLTDETIAWMGADLNTPSFAMVSHFSVHAPIMATPEDVAQFDGTPPGTFHSDPVYGGMLYNLDANIGRLLTWLEETDDPRRDGDKLIDNTLFLVVSDNGASGGYDGVGEQHEVSNQRPLRGGKGTVWEGGVRVPMWIRWDRGQAAGQVSDELVMHLDLTATVLDIAGVDDHGTPPVDGVTLRPLIERDGGTIGRDQIFLHYPVYNDFQDLGDLPELRESPSSAAWQDDWKLIYRYDTQSWELYDLAIDIGETANVAAAHPDVVAFLGSKLVQWLVDTDAALPRFKETATVVPLPDPSTL